MKYTDLSSSANFSHFIAKAQRGMTICFSQNLKFAPCPNFKLHCLKGLCKFPILLLITVFSKPQCVYVPLHWPQQRLALHSTGGREAPHLQIVTYLRYVTIFMIDTILIIIFFTIGVRSIGAAGIQFKGLQSFLTNIYTIQLGNVGIHMLAWPGKCSFKSLQKRQNTIRKPW